MAELARDQIVELKERNQLLEMALKHYMREYPTCPCGAWVDRLSERNHVPGCPVARALEFQEVNVGG